MKDRLRNDKIDGIAGEPIEFKNFSKDLNQDNSRRDIKVLISTIGLIVLTLLLSYLGFYLGSSVEKINSLNRENRTLIRKIYELEDQVKKWENNFSESLLKISTKLDSMQNQATEIEKDKSGK